MRFLSALSLTALNYFTAQATQIQSTHGIEALVRRRIPELSNSFVFSLSNTSSAFEQTGLITAKPNDEFTVSNDETGRIAINGNSQSALASGLHWYLSTYVHVDIYWFIGSRLDLAPSHLPPVNATYHGSSVVPWRYHFNTVTFSYTSAFWTWEDWELQLDWMALRGINLPLAWVGYERILADVFADAGFSQAEIYEFLSGPAFQAWNRFGNIQGSWGGNLTSAWNDGQYELQKKIVSRMVELGMTPVLPAFTGFMPRSIGTRFPNAIYVNGSQWSGFPSRYTNVSFLEPFDPLYTTLQKSFVQKQTEAFGNITSIRTLDIYNENNPYSGDLEYLRNATSNIMSSLRAADPKSTWMLQGWLFYSSSTFWTNDRVEAFLGGVNNTDMLIIDLFSESNPQWQRTNSYYGKPWLWCELHGYGGNTGLYGQVSNVTVNSMEALRNTTSTMIGMGLTMEGEEGNEIMYDLLLDQAWSNQSLIPESYFHDWVTSRYYGSGSIPTDLYTAWDIMSKTVYNNTNLKLATAVTKSIFVLAPNTTGLLNRTGHHATVITYSTTDLVKAWSHLWKAACEEPSLWRNRAYTFDLVDVTRQVLANAFDPLYSEFVIAAANRSSHATATTLGARMITLLSDLDAILVASGEPHFNLAAWIAAARAWAPHNDRAVAAFYEYDARNQVTLWGPRPYGQIDDYASKQWGGLIGSYYVPRWERFVKYTINGTTGPQGQNEALRESLAAFETAWQTQSWDDDKETVNQAISLSSDGSELQHVMTQVLQRRAAVFGMPNPGR